jgi:hypothetical protein
MLLFLSVMNVFRDTCLYSYPQRWSGYNERCYNKPMLQQTNATTNQCYNKQFLSIKSGCYNEKLCYNERGGILFIMESSIMIFTSERLFVLFMCFRLFMLFNRESLLIVFTKESLFVFFKFTCRVYKS